MEKERVLHRDLKDYTGQEVTIEGWLHKTRKLGGLNFLVIRDRSGLTQVTVKDEAEMEKLRGLQQGTVLEVAATVAEDDRAPGGIELRDPDLEVLVPVEDDPPIEVDKPIDHTPDNFDTLFEYRTVNLRNLEEQNIFQIRSEVLHYLRQYLRQHEFVEIQTPKIIPGATEGGAEAFRLDYFEQEAYLAQSPQFYKQIMVGVFERVYEIGPAFRAEPSMTSRHLSEVSMLDIEMGFVEELDDLLTVTSRLINYVVGQMWSNHADWLESVDATQPQLPDEYPVYTLKQVHELYTEAGDEDTTGEKDLTPAEERFICQHAKEEEGSEAVFVTEFPASDMKFYHKLNEDNPKVTDRADVLFRGLELATIPLREHRYDKLVEQIKADGIDPEDPGFKYYLQAFQYGLPPHGGFGFGIDRFVQQIIRLDNIKEATLFPRDMNRLTP